MTTLVSDPTSPGGSIVAPGPQVVTLPSGATFQPSDISKDTPLPPAGAMPYWPGAGKPIPTKGAGWNGELATAPPPGQLENLKALIDPATGLPKMPPENLPTDLTKPNVAAAIPKEDPQAKANNYIAQTLAVEGDGPDPRSSAVGGFLKETWLEEARKVRPDLRGMPDAEVLALRNDNTPAGKAFRGQVAAQYATDNTPTLQKAGFPITPTNLRLAHLLGAQGAVQALTSDPYRLFSEVNPTAAAANPSLQGKTVGEVIQLANDQMNGTTRADLMRQSTGPFNAGAMPLLQEWQSDIARKSKEYDAALAEGKDLRTVARAAMKKWEYETDHPPQDMRQAWNQYAAGAIGLALIGGFFGRNHTAAINAAGEMLQAANAADVRAYEIAYKKWKDHNDNGLKMIELLHGEARDIVNDAKNSYDMTLTKLTTLSTAYHLGQAMDPQSLENQIKQKQLVEATSKLIEQQHDFEKKKQDEAKEQAAVDEMVKKYKVQYGSDPPPDVLLQFQGEAKKIAAGTAYKAGAIKEYAVKGPDGVGSPGTELEFAL